MEHLKLRCIPEIPANQAAGVRSPPRRSEAGTPRRRQSIYIAPVEPSMKGPPGGINDVPVEPLKISGGKARAYYQQEFDQSPDNFVRMLILDSCFIIRIILAVFQPLMFSLPFLDADIKAVRSDLLLLENQIPLFFIREVFSWLFPSLCNQTLKSFNTALESFICLDMPWRINDRGMSSKAVHLLDLYWRCSLSPKMYRKLDELEGDHSEKEQTSWAEIHLSINAPIGIPNATELEKTVGFKFEKFEEKGHLDVIFSERSSGFSIIQMPRLKINSRLTTLLVNLIAFENSILPTMRTFSSYMKLMDALIDSKKDVEFLEKCGVIDNTLGSNEMAATFFKDIGEFCFVDSNTNHFRSLYEDVQKYCCSYLNRHRARLLNDYFNNPWAIPSLINAVILLYYTSIQTVFTVLQYYSPKK
ncbi:UPF0481 protein At3g47200-like [Carex rostrata]